MSSLDNKEMQTADCYEQLPAPSLSLLCSPCKLFPVICIMRVWEALTGPLKNVPMKAKPLLGFLLYLLQSHSVKRHELEGVQANIFLSTY